jgi:DNA-binding GntR family transcriptional regulator
MTSLMRGLTGFAPMGGPVSRKVTRAGTTVGELVRSLADSIVTGALRPGEKLDEASLAARFDVSRTPVREALRQLSAMNLVEHRPNRGAIVARMTQAHLASMFEGMAELEAICARFSAERMSIEERRLLEAGHTASARLVHGGHEEEYEAYNIEFHGRLYAGAHSAHIEEMTNMTRARLAPFRRAQFRMPRRLEQSFREHDAIVSAILRGDGERAAAAARAHVSIVSETSAAFLIDGHPAAMTQAGGGRLAAPST